MVIDSSAIVAVVFEEPEGERFLELALTSQRKLVGTVSKLEADIVVRARKGAPGARRLEKFYDEIAITFVDFSAADLKIAGA
ncbi:MAG: type II toxin-antitoxin system VapC family toxin [Chloroflexota bacterium]